MQAHVASDSPRRQKGGRGAYLPCRLHATAPLDGTASRRNPIYPAINTEPIDRGVLSKIQGRAARKVNRNASVSGAAIGVWRTPPWLPSVWGCRGRRLSRG